MSWRRLAANPDDAVDEVTAPRTPQSMLAKARRMSLIPTDLMTVISPACMPRSTRSAM